MKMETRQRSRRTNSSRKPLSDCTNTVNSSQSSSASTSTLHKPQNPFLSSLIPKLLSHSNTNSTTTVSTSSASTSQNDDASNTGDLLLQSLHSTPLRPPGKVDREVSETNSVYSRRAASQKRKKGTPAEHISSNLGKTKENEDKNLPKARTAPRKKRHESSRTDVNKSPKTDVSKSALPQEFIEQQKAYYAEIDAFELPEEEVESIYDLE